MSELLLPVLLASLAGGLHCAGMCGPFSAAAGAYEGPASASVMRQMPYHLGRLVTYLGLGGVAGALGHALDMGGALGGFPRISALIAGATMIVFALSSLFSRQRLVKLVKLRRQPGPARNRLAEVLVAIGRRAPVERAFLLGLATTLIPCGWLYAFVATAAGSGAVGPALSVMVAFWFGTLPWLLGASFGLRALVPRLGARVRTASACLIAASGLALIFLRMNAPVLAAADSGTAVPSMPADCPFHKH